MFNKSFFTFIVLAVFLFGCGNAKQDAEQKKAPDAKERNEKSAAGPEEAGNTVTLATDVLERAGIKIEPVALRPLNAEYAFSGSVEVDETRLAHVGPRISGRALEVYANLGDHVKKGQPLALIDSPDVAEAQSQYLKAKTNLDVAEKSYERAKIVLEGKVISTGEFQKREGEYLSAQADARVAEDRLHLLGMTDAEIASIGKAHSINSRVPIFSPISGSVIERHLTVGEVVEPAKPLFSVADLKSLWVIADIPEGDIPKIRRGAAVSIAVTPYPEKAFRGKINYISETVNPETRTIKVRADVENTKGMLKPEMFATVRISSGEKKSFLSVPESAIQLDGDKTVVFVTRDGNTFEKRVIEAGPALDGFHQVISGLKEGERVVTKGAFTLKSETLKGTMEAE